MHFRRSASLAIVLFGTAHAATLDCSSLHVFLADPMPAVMTYDIPATFPEPKKTVLKALWDMTGMKAEPFVLNECGISAESDGNRVSVQAESFERLMEITGMRTRNILKKQEGFHFLGYKKSWWTYPELKMDLNVVQTELVIPADMKLIFVGDKFPWTEPEQIVGIQVNEGPLQPLFYDNKGTNVDLKDARQVDIYLKKTADRQFARISVDFVKPRITVWKEHDFPTP